MKIRVSELHLELTVTLTIGVEDTWNSKWPEFINDALLWSANESAIEEEGAATAPVQPPTIAPPTGWPLFPDGLEGPAAGPTSGSCTATPMRRRAETVLVGTGMEGAVFEPDDT